MEGGVTSDAALDLVRYVQVVQVKAPPAPPTPRPPPPLLGLHLTEERGRSKYAEEEQAPKDVP